MTTATGDPERTARRRGRTAAPLVAAALAVGLGLAAAGDEAAAGGAGDVRTLSLVGTPTSFALAGGGGERPLAPGDAFAFTERLDRGGERFGSNTGTCAVVTAQRLQCSITTRLAGGSLQVEGVSAPAGVVRLAITGGTGRYEGASGSVRVDTRPARDRLAFRILRRG